MDWKLVPAMVSNIFTNKRIVPVEFTYTKVLSVEVSIALKCSKIK